MKKMVTLYEKGAHSWRVVARDPSRPNHLIDTNEYLISHGDATLLTDPGGQEVFPAVFAAIAEGWDPRKINTLFSSHQDPDVISSLALWLDFNPAIKCHTSWLWCSFIPHFGGDEGTRAPRAGRRRERSSSSDSPSVASRLRRQPFHQPSRCLPPRRSCRPR